MSGGEALTPAERTYFDSGGTTDPPAAADSTPATEGDAAAQQPEVDEADETHGGRKKNSATVSIGALHEERARRREEEARHEETRRQHAADMARVDERLRMLQGVVQPQPQPLPAFAQDPQGHIEGRLGQLEQGQRFTFEQQQQIAAQQQQQAAREQVLAFGRQKANEFAAKTPDYAAAEQHLLALRTAHLRTLRIPEPQIAAQISNEIVQIAAMAMQQGTDPADTIYRLAKDAGYTPKQAAAAAAADGNPLAITQRGQQLATNIGSAGAAAPPKLSAQALLSMSDAEFAKMLSSDRSGEIDKIMGDDNFEDTPRSGRR